MLNVKYFFLITLKISLHNFGLPINNFIMLIFCIFYYLFIFLTITPPKMLFKCIETFMHTIDNGFIIKMLKLNFNILQGSFLIIYTAKFKHKLYKQFLFYAVKDL